MNSRAMETTYQNNVNDKSSYQRFINWDTNFTIGKTIYIYMMGFQYTVH